MPATLVRVCVRVRICALANIRAAPFEKFQTDLLPKWFSPAAHLGVSAYLSSSRGMLLRARSRIAEDERGIELVRALPRIIVHVCAIRIHLD